MLKETDVFGVYTDKVAMAIERLKSFEPPEGYYLAYSGGKDSTVILELARMSGVKFDAHYHLTTVDPPELVYFIKQQKDVEIERPKTPFLVELVKRGFPVRQGRWCCETYKEGGGSGRIVMTGVRGSESTRRRKRKMVEVCIKDTTKRYLHLIFDWTEQEVWEFIKGNNIPYCKLYDEGFKRLGCLFCPMASNKARSLEVKRYPKFVAAFRKAFVKVYIKKKSEGKVSVNRWANGEEMFDWWLTGKGFPKEEKDQFMMFDSE